MPSDAAPGQYAHGVQSVDRAVTSLEYLARAGWSGVTEIAEALGVHKSTASRLVGTLERRGLVIQHEDTGKYHLGFGLVHLARSVAVGFDLKQRARPVCERLADETGETVVLAVADGHTVVNIDQIIPQSGIVSMSWMGRRTPLHCTANGKALLAHLPAGQREEILASPHERLTPSTVVERTALEAQVDAVLRDGYAFALEEFEEGLNAVAAPILATDGELLGSLSVSAPSWRLPVERVPEVGKLAAAAAREIGGYADATAAAGAAL